MAAPNWQQVAWLRFLLAVALIAILTITSRYVLGQPWHEFVKDLLPNLTATSIGLATGWILVRGISESDQLLDKIVTKTDALIHDEVQRTTKAVLDAVYESAEIAKSVTPLAPRQIRDHLALVASSPGEYRFLGNSGKHLAAVSIPHLATIEAHSYEVPIWIQLLDPDGDDGIRRYCDDRKCSKDEVRAEIYATILLACLVSHQSPLSHRKTICQNDANALSSRLVQDALRNHDRRQE